MKRTIKSRFRSFGVVWTAILLGSVPTVLLGSVPNLAVEYQQSVATNGVLEVSVRRLAETSAVPVRVAFNWKDERGVTVIPFAESKLVSTNEGDRIGFSRRVPGLKCGRLLYPQLIVESADAPRQVFAYGFCPVDIRPTLDVETPKVVQTLPKMLPPGSLAFSVSAVPQSDEYELQAEVIDGKTGISLEFFENERMIFSATNQADGVAFRFRPHSVTAILRARMQAEDGCQYYAPALRVPNPLAFSPGF